MTKKCVVLLSGGIDSTTCLAIAVARYGADSVLALSAFYGQRHAKELLAAKKISDFYGVEQMEIDLMDAFSLSECPLIGNDRKIKHLSYADQLEELGGEGTVDTYVPFRNGLFLSYAASVAVSIKAMVIYYGAHKDDAAGRAYPDCTPEFNKAMGRAILEGSAGACRLEAPLLLLNKAEVIFQGLQLGAPYHLSWSCYEGGKEPCGKCATCLDRKAAFAKLGILDPA